MQSVKRDFFTPFYAFLECVTLDRLGTTCVCSWAQGGRFTGTCVAVCAVNGSVAAAARAAASAVTPDTRASPCARDPLVGGDHVNADAQTK